jgi:hypothetical protein
VIVDNGKLFESSTPTVGASWKERSFGGVPFHGVSCPSVNLCLAVNQNGQRAVGKS